MTIQDKHITIESDGTPLGTKVYDANGHEMDVGIITRIEWVISGADAIADAKVTFARPHVRLRGRMSDG